MARILGMGVCQLVLDLKIDNRIYIIWLGRHKEKSILGKSKCGEYGGVIIGYDSA